MKARKTPLNFAKYLSYSEVQKDRNVVKGNAQFVFLCNPPKSGASLVCIIFPHITQKILTKDIIRWLERIVEILRFLQIFSVRKTTTQYI